MLDSRQGSGLRWRVEPVRKAGYEGEIEGEEAEVRLSWTVVDGDCDLVAVIDGRLHGMENFEDPQGGFLNVHLVGAVSNSQAIGSKIYTPAGLRNYCQNSGVPGSATRGLLMLGASVMSAPFEVTINWPSGTIQTEQVDFGVTSIEIEEFPHFDNLISPCHFPQTFPTYFHSLSPPPRADLTFSTKLQDVHHDSSFFF